MDYMKEMPAGSPSKDPSIPEWRLRKIGRPVHSWDFDLHDWVERDPNVPERLYRQIPIEDVYLTWRDKEMPLQHFKGSPHSSVEDNSIGNFWFDRPICLDRFIEGYVITEPSRWSQQPEFFQESQMTYKSNAKEKKNADLIKSLGAWADYGPNKKYGLSKVPEFHTGNRLQISELTICLSSLEHKHLSDELASLKQIDTLSKDSLARSGLYRRIFKLREREHGELPEGQHAAETPSSNADAYSEKQLRNPEFVQSLMQFYEWALTLPVIPASCQPFDMEDAEEFEEESKRKEREFIEFYKGIAAPSSKDSQKDA
jgi:hypothetical protein